MIQCNPIMCSFHSQPLLYKHADQNIMLCNQCIAEQSISYQSIKSVDVYSVTAEPLSEEIEGISRSIYSLCNKKFEKVISVLKKSTMESLPKDEKMWEEFKQEMADMQKCLPILNEEFNKNIASIIKSTENTMGTDKIIDKLNELKERINTATNKFKTGIREKVECAMQKDVTELVIAAQIEEDSNEEKEIEKNKAKKDESKIKNRSTTLKRKEKEKEIKYNHTKKKANKKEERKREKEREKEKEKEKNQKEKEKNKNKNKDNDKTKSKEKEKEKGNQKKKERKKRKEKENKKEKEKEKTEDADSNDEDLSQSQHSDEEEDKPAKKVKKIEEKVKPNKLWHEAEFNYKEAKKQLQIIGLKYSNTNESIKRIKTLNPDVVCFIDCEFDMIDFTMFFSLAITPHPIKMIKFKKMNISKEFLVYLYSSFNFSSLDSLVFSNCSIDVIQDLKAGKLWEIIEWNNSHLKCIKFRNCGIIDYMLPSLKSALLKNKFLETIDLSKNLLTAAGLRELFTVSNIAKYKIKQIVLKNIEKAAIAKFPFASQLIKN